MKTKTSLLSTITIIYVAIIIIWSGLGWLIGSRSWWMVTLTYFQVELFAPAPLILIAALISRKRHLILLSLLPPLLFIFIFWPYVIPHLATESPTSNLRVMTYNVLFSNTDDQAVANVIKTYQPDLVALQEVQPETMSALEKALADQYPYSLLGDENPYGTTAVFSQHPLSNGYILDLKFDRPAVVVEVNVNDQPVTFISAHLLAYGLRWVPILDIPQAIIEKTALQNRQAQQIIDDIRNKQGVIILGCDCNSRERLSSYQMLNGVFENTARKVGWRIRGQVPNGVKQDRYLKHIDYIFYRGLLQPVSIFTVEDYGGSDHAPVFADFVLLEK